MSKVRNNERGRGGVERRLVALGARPRDEGEPGRAWLEEALHTVGARVVAHGGNHKYVFRLGRTRREREEIELGLPALWPYPKQADAEPAATWAESPA